MRYPPLSTRGHPITLRKLTYYGTCFVSQFARRDPWRFTGQLFFYSENERRYNYWKGVRGPRLILGWVRTKERFAKPNLFWTLNLQNQFKEIRNNKCRWESTWQFMVPFICYSLVFNTKYTNLSLRSLSLTDRLNFILVY